MATETNNPLDVTKMIGRRVLMRDANGRCKTGRLETMYPHAYPVGEPTEVKGWGKFDGRRQWYRLGTDQPETAWHFCLAE